ACACVRQIQTHQGPQEWYKLQSKSGKKEKERGELQVSVQFTCNNMTASMFDLSMKDKPRSTFGKLKDKMKGKKLSDLDSASAIVPSSRGRLDSDDSDRAEGKKTKSKGGSGFFRKPKLRKSSLSKSNTSLSSDSTETSVGSGTISPGPGLFLPSPPPSSGAHLKTSGGLKANDDQHSPKPMTHKRAFSDEVSQVTSLPEPKGLPSLQPKNAPLSRSSLCVNGSHVYKEEPLADSSSSSSNLLPKSSLLSRSLQNLAHKSEETPKQLSKEAADRRWTLSGLEKPGTKALTLNSPSGPGRKAESRAEVKPMQVATPIVSTAEAAKEKPHEEGKKDKKSRMGLFHYGSGKSESGNKSPLHKVQSPPATSPEEKTKGNSWFSSKDTKDSSQKP
uniref:Uncharacterized protein n=1 Tax=Latimeria chalumnae TaxID=7897 RepID=H2ZZZ8_LATCH